MRLFLLFLFAALSLSCGHFWPSNTDFEYDDPVYVDLDFDDQTHEPWVGQYNTEPSGDSENFFLSTDTPSGSGYSAVFTLYSGGDYWLSPNNGLESARSEIQLKGTAPEGHTIYYSWDFFIPSSYVESEDWQVIAQFHDQPDPAIGQTWANYPANSPPVSFRYRQGELILSVWDFERNLKMDALATPLTKGQWHNLKFKIHWSVDQDGTIELWLNGNRLMENDQEVYQAPNCYNPAGNYLKIGLYRSKDILSFGQVLYDNVLSGPTAESIGLLE